MTPILRRPAPGFFAAALVMTLAGHLTAQQPAQQAPAEEIPHKYVDYTIETKMAPAAFEKVDPKAAGIDPAALDRLVKRAQETHSDALVILKDGKLVGDWRFGKPAEPIEAMSATKSVVNVAIGRLVYTGKIRSIDQPVSDFFPAWKEGPKKDVTLRHLLNHTSGLRANASTEEIYGSRDILKLALDADLAHPPGTEFFYNNKAVNILAGVVEKASGKKLDVYMRDEVFTPLGVRHFLWMRDPSGNPHAMAGLALDALDLAKIGQLMLDGGVYRGQRIVSAEWVKESVATAQTFNPTCGLLWWVVPEWSKMEIDDAILETWRKGGSGAAFLEKVSTLKGKGLAQDELFAELDRLFGAGKGIEAYMTNVRLKNLPSPKVTAGPAVGFSANGYFGQYIVVLPGPRIVVVRQIFTESHQSDADDFSEVKKLARELVPQAAK
jgi:CubicO group peptidase (beta-lactamase class C family)